MSTSLLNLDALKITRTVVLGGRERLLRSMSVRQYVEADRFEEQFLAADTAGRAALLVDKVLEFLDGTTSDELLALDMAQLTALLAFARGTDLSDAAATPANGGAAGNGDAGSN